MTLDIRTIDDTIAVAPQIAPEDIAALKAAGFALVVNNRPDGESEDQPDGDEIAALCARVGLDYRAIPITHAGFSHPQVRAMIDTLATAPGPVFAFLPIGYAIVQPVELARAAMGDDADAVTAKAAEAGYDLTALRPLLDSLAPKD